VSLVHKDESVSISISDIDPIDNRIYKHVRAWFHTTTKKSEIYRITTTLLAVASAIVCHLRYDRIYGLEFASSITTAEKAENQYDLNVVLVATV
jgi:hypothetical protein